MGFDKLNAELNGVSVLARSVLAFQNCPDITEIRVVTSNEKLAEVTELAVEIKADKFIEAVEGGTERHLSVWNGIQKVDAMNTRLIAVHDGARPLVTPAAISACAEVASQCGGASLAHRITDTLKRANADSEVSESISRDNLWAMETPQIFDAKLLCEAYRKILEQGEPVTDEVSALQAIGVKVRLVENAEPNPKITVSSDLVLAKKMLQDKA